MKKIVINRCYGGFGLSYDALQALGIESEHDIERDDPKLVAVVESMGNKANCRFSELKVVEIPEDVQYFIDEYDGIECIRENHRVWCK
jgi:translation initiation factor 2 alpha subunit (eIF-2alpha)